MNKKKSLSLGVNGILHRMLIGDISKVKLVFGNVGFCGEGKTGVPEKISWSKDENQQQAHYPHDGECGNQTWATLVGGECPHHEIGGCMICNNSKKTPKGRVHASTALHLPPLPTLGCITTTTTIPFLILSSYDS